MSNNSSDIRKIDELGRIVLPKTVRTELGLNTADSVKIIVDNGRIIIEPYSSVCIFCGGNSELIEFNGKTACRKCLEEALKR